MKRFFLYFALVLLLFSCNGPEPGSACEWALGKWRDKATGVELFTIYADGYEMGGERLKFGENNVQIFTATESEFTVGVSAGGIEVVAFSLRENGDTYEYSLGLAELYLEAVRDGNDAGGGETEAVMDETAFMLAMSKAAFANVTADIRIPDNSHQVLESGSMEILYKATADAEYMGGPVRIFLKDSGDADKPYRYFHVGSGEYSAVNSNEWKNTASLSTALNGFLLGFMYENKPYRLFSKLSFSDFTDAGGGWYSYIDRKHKLYDSDDEIYEARLKFGSDKKLAEVKILYYECLEAMSNPHHEKGAVFASYIFSDYGSTRIDDLPKDGVVIYRLHLDADGGTGGSDGLCYTPGGAGVEAGWYGDASLKVKKTEVNVPSKSYTVAYYADNVEYTGIIPRATSRFDFAGYHIDGNVEVIDSQGSMRSEILQHFTLAEDMTAYADWENQTGITLPVPSATKTRTFVQWKKNGAPVSSLYYPVGNTTLVAEWTNSLNPCKLTLNDNGGESGSGVLYYTKGNYFVAGGLYSDSFCTESITDVAIPEKYYLVSFSTNNSEYTQPIEGLKSHFGFQGYWLGDLCLIDSDGHVDSNKLKSLNLSSGVTLTAKWGSENASVNVADVENTQHHLFRGWKLNGSRVTGAYKPAGSITLQGTWIDIYKLTLDDNGGSGGSGALYYTNGEGATVAGWYSDNVLTIPKSAVAIPSRVYIVKFDVNNRKCTETIDDQTLTFTFNGYKLSDNIKIGSDGSLVGYTIPSDTTISADWGGQSSIILPTLTDMTNFKFKGWNNGDTLLTGNTYIPDSSVTLKAAWCPEVSCVFVEGGSFILGDSSEGDNSSVSVTLDSFYICDHEVTQAEYEAVMGTNPSSSSGDGRPSSSRDNLPVENVTWYDAVEYCNKLSELNGLDKCYSGSGDSIVCDWSKNGYRLPTEAEWEYAARGRKNSLGDKYSGSNALGDVAWYDGNSDRKVHDVKTRAANELGLYDMSGNVWEWCWDWYKSSYDGGNNPVGATSGGYRVKRGGSYLDQISDCSVFYRRSSSPTSSNSTLGFRVVRSR